MFTGIVEELGEIRKLSYSEGNLHLRIKAPMSPELKIDQSVAHNGVCLTVVELSGDSYCVTAISETLEKTNLKYLQEGDLVNLERGMRLGSRLDGHIVQGHVDQIGYCIEKKNRNGSWKFSFKYDPQLQNVTIAKGSITIDGVSLTVVDSGEEEFSVAVIPYTYQNTNFRFYEVGSVVNLEFDVIGKYVKRLIQQ